MRCSFTVAEPLVEAGVHHFTSCAEAEGFPVAEAVLAVPGVAEVVVSDRTITVVKRGARDWFQLEEPIKYAIETAAAEPGAEVGPSDGVALDDDAMFDLVAQIFEREVNPSVASHGGRVDLIDVQDSTVIVRMQGGCQGCGMANVTLRQGIEGSLRRVIPMLRGIEDITDHSAGTNPYFASEKK
jgi:Fe-S cluster biogenesis protein NfuA